jgi:hypothetical protein
MECILCHEEVLETDDISDTGIYGGAYSEEVSYPHRECMFRSVAGGIGHHEDHHFWCTLIGDPDGGRTYRESARQVLKRYQQGRLILS